MRLLFNNTILLLTIYLSSCTSLAANNYIKPYNIILIMADDLGIETIEAFGGNSYKTPSINQLASEGIRFNHAHSQPLCTPTRVKVMTGLYNFRNYQHFAYLSPESTTFAHLLKKQGYATGIFGKWQLTRSSRAPESITGILPENAGFDEHVLWQVFPKTRGKRYWQPTLTENGKLTTYGTKEFGPKILNDRLLDFIERKKDQVFFAYYPMLLAHDPFVTTPDNLSAQTKQEKFTAMVQYMDKMVGNVRTKVEKLGIAERTIIIFTGDNGTHKSIVSIRNGQKVIGGKGKTDNTGTSVPFIVFGPNVKFKGSVSNALINFNDLLPSLIDFAGAKLPEGVQADGSSITPLINNPQERGREQIFIHYDPRWGKRKLKRYVFDTKWKLYQDGRFFDLTRDPTEISPIAPADMTAVMKNNYTRLKTIIDSMPSSQF
ncbi:MAG: sulfatase-like hydrolase/transferase [Colwellia sp.]|nr:sulfatase-like hydrolase/transferase [Colwellia sp.]